MRGRRTFLLVTISSLTIPFRVMADGAASEIIVTAPMLTAAGDNATGRDVPLGGPLKDGDFILGDIDYLLRADSRIILNPNDLLVLLRPVVSPSAWQALAVAIADRESIEAGELQAYGFPVTYDPATFGLTVTIPTDLRPRRSLSINGGYEQTLGKFQPPERLSAYVTAYGAADYVSKSIGQETGFSEPSFQLDSAVRYGGVVLENEASINNDFRREGTRLVYDDLSRTARWTLGDLEPVSRGFAGANALAGLSVVRSYADLEPQRNVQPRGQRSFTLVRPSTVETFVNGRSVQQARLAPGNYDVSDFPFAQGSNDVRLVIRDDFGVETTFSFSIFFDRSLLAKGLTEFGVFAGAEAPFDQDGRNYTGNPGASGFYRRGFSDELTAGGNFQVNDRGGVVGGEVVWAAPIGTLGLDLAGSSVEAVGEGYAINASFERVFGASDGGGGGTRSMTATFQSLSENFATPTQLIALNPFVFETGVTYSQSVGRTQYVTADAFYSAGRGAQEDQLTARVTHGWRANSRVLLSTEAAYEDRRGQSEFGVRFALTYRFSQYSSGRAEVDSRRERARVGYQTSRGRGVGSWSAAADLDRYDSASGLNASYTTIQNRAELGASHQTSFSNDGGDITDQRTSVRVGTSLAFAGGSFAVSRPIYDSFAIVKSHRSLDGSPVYVDPRDESYTARSGLMGGAVAPELSAYSPRVITFDVPDAPVGYDLGAGAVQVLPPYRAGYLVVVGSDYSVSLTGQLTQEDGTPIGLLAGRAFEEGEPERAPIDMFTNKSGRFAIQGLRPGRWRIEMPTGRPTVFIIDVPARAQGLVRLGALKPEVRQ